MLQKLEEFFPLKSFKVCSEDGECITKEIKKLDRSRKREFEKRGKSVRWKHLDELFNEKSKSEKEKYNLNIV